MPSEYDELDSFLASGNAKPVPSAMPKSDYGDLDAFLDGKTPAPAPSGITRRVLGDSAVSLARGVVGLPESGIGLMDLALTPQQAIFQGGLNLMTGKPLTTPNIVSPGIVGRMLKHGIGPVTLDTQSAKNTISEGYSPEQNEANRRVQDAKGFVDTAKTIVQNPSTIAQGIVESAPGMLAGGAASQAILANVPKLAAVKGIGPIIAGATEGALSMGSSAEQVRQAAPEGKVSLGQAAIAAGTGVLTGLISAYGGKFAGDKGLIDPNVWLAKAGANTTVEKNFVLRVLGGGFSEGGQEFLQSAQEQIGQNIATGKPWSEGVPNGALQGFASGFGMGAGFNALGAGDTGNGKPKTDDTADYLAQLKQEFPDEPVPQAEGVNGQPVQPVSEPTPTPDTPQVVQAATTPLGDRLSMVDALHPRPQPVEAPVVESQDALDPQMPNSPTQVPRVEEGLTMDDLERQPLVEDVPAGIQPSRPLGKPAPVTIAPAGEILQDRVVPASEPVAPAPANKPMPFRSIITPQKDEAANPYLIHATTEEGARQILKDGTIKKGSRGSFFWDNGIDGANGEALNEWNEGKPLVYIAIPKSAVQGKTVKNDDWMRDGGAVRIDGDVALPEGTMVSGVESEDNQEPEFTPYSKTTPSGPSPIATQAERQAGETSASISKEPIIKEGGSIGSVPRVEQGPIPYSKSMDIRNLDALSGGTGARYLEVIKGEGDSYIAKQWRRKPVKGALFIDMTPGKGLKSDSTEVTPDNIAKLIGLSEDDTAPIVRTSGGKTTITLARMSAAKWERVKAKAGLAGFEEGFVATFPDGTVQPGLAMKASPPAPLSTPAETPVPAETPTDKESLSVEPAPLPKFKSPAELRKYVAENPDASLDGVDPALLKQAIATAKGKVKDALKGKVVATERVAPVSDKGVDGEATKVKVITEEEYKEKLASFDRELAASNKRLKRDILDIDKAYAQKAFANREPVDADRIDKAKIKLPEGYRLVDMRYVHESDPVNYPSPVKAIPPAVAKQAVRVTETPTEKVVSVPSATERDVDLFPTDKSKAPTLVRVRNRLTELQTKMDSDEKMTGDEVDKLQSRIERLQLLAAGIEQAEIDAARSAAAPSDIKPKTTKHVVRKDVAGFWFIVDPDGNIVRGEQFGGRNGAAKAIDRAKELDSNADTSAPIKNGSIVGEYRYDDFIYDLVVFKDGEVYKVGLRKQGTNEDPESWGSGGARDPEMAAKRFGEYEASRGTDRLAVKHPVVKAAFDAETKAIDERATKLEAEGDARRVAEQDKREKATAYEKAIGAVAIKGKRETLSVKGQDGSKIDLTGTRYGGLFVDKRSLDSKRSEYVVTHVATGARLFGSPSLSTATDFVRGVIHSGAELDFTMDALNQDSVKKMRAVKTFLDDGVAPDVTPTPTPVKPPKKASARAIEKLDALAKKHSDDLKKMGGNIGMNPDPTRVYHMAVIAAAKIAKTGIQFGQWADEMVKEHGPEIVRHLSAIWTKANQILKANDPQTAPPEVTDASTVTSINKETTDAEYAAKGYPEGDVLIPEEVAGVTAEAKAAVDANPALLDSTVKGFIDEPHAPKNTVELGILLLAKATREAAWRKANTELEAARKSGDQARIKTAQEAYNLADAADREMSQLLVTGDQSPRTLLGRGLNYLKTQLAEDFSVVRVIRDLEQANDGKPIDEEAAREISKQLTDAKTTLDGLNREGAKKKIASLYEEIKRIREEDDAKIAEKDAEKDAILEKANEEWEKQTAVLESMLAENKNRKASKKMIESGDADIAAADAIFKSLGVQMTMGINPEIIKALGLYARGYVKKGVGNYSIWRQEMRTKFKGIDIEKHLHDAYTEALDAANTLRVEEESAPIIESIKKDRAEKPAADIADRIKQLMRKQAENKVATVEQASENVSKELIGSLPDMTPSEVLRLYSDYGKTSSPSNKPTAKQLAQWRSQARNLTHIQRLIKRRDLIQKGLPFEGVKDATTEHTGQQRDKPDARTRELQRQVAKLNKEIEREMVKAGIKVKKDDRQIASYRQARQSALKNQIEDYERSMVERRKLLKNDEAVADDPETARLRKLRDERKAQYDAMFPKEPLNDEQIVTRALKHEMKALERIQKQYEDAKAGILPTAKDKDEKPSSAELDAIRDERDFIKNDIRTLYELLKPKASAEEQAVESKIKRLQAQEKGINKRIADNDFTPKQQAHVEIWNNPEAMEAQKRLGEAKIRLAELKEKYRFENLSWMGKRMDRLGGAWDAVRDATSSFDFSAIGRQGWIPMLTRFPQWATAVRKSAMASTSANSAKIFQEYKDSAEFRKGWTRYLKMSEDDGGGNFTRIDDRGKLRMVSWVPGIKWSNRTYATFLNTIRFELFKSYLKYAVDPQKPTVEELKEISNMINDFSGSGRVPYGGAPMLSRFIYAPSFVFGQFHVLTGSSLRSSSPTARKIARREYAKLIGNTVILMALAGALGGEDDEGVEMDPTSSNFGTFKVGHQRVGVLGYMRPMIVLASRLAMGKMKTANGYKRLYNELPPWSSEKGVGAKVDFGSGLWPLIGNFAKSKLHPGAGLIAKVMSGQDYIGKPIGKMEAIAESVTPITPQQVIDLAKTETDIKLMALIAGSLAGLDVRQDYNDPVIKRLNK